MSATVVMVEDGEIVEVVVVVVVVVEEEVEMELGLKIGGWNGE